MVGPSRFRLPGGKTFTDSIGNGPKRVNSDTRSHPPPNVGHPRGSVAYLDHIISHWDFGRGKVGFFPYYCSDSGVLSLSLPYSMFVRG